MTLQARYLTSHSLYLCNHTHLIDDITTYVCMKSHPLPVRHQRHYIWHHILSWWHHITFCMPWHPLSLWHHIHYIWCHTHYVSDNTSSISDLKSILSAFIATVYIITSTLSKTSHQLCKTSQVAYVCHHVHYTWHRIHPLWQQPFVLMTSQDYIWHIVYCVWYHIHYMCDIRKCLYLRPHTLYVKDICTLYGITHIVMTTQPLCNFTATTLTSHPLYLCCHT